MSLKWLLAGPLWRMNILLISNKIAVEDLVLLSLRHGNFKRKEIVFIYFCSREYMAITSESSILRQMLRGKTENTILASWQYCQPKFFPVDIYIRSLLWTWVFHCFCLVYLLQITSQAVIGHKSLDEELLIEIQSTLYGHRMPEGWLDGFLTLDIPAAVNETVPLWSFKTYLSKGKQKSN